MPKELAVEECRDRLYRHVATMVEYWLTEGRAPDAREKMNGLVFSIFAALDGCAGDLPGFRVLTDPHPDDRAYSKKNGEDWWPEGEDIGTLHEHWHYYEPKAAHLPP